MAGNYGTSGYGIQGNSGITKYALSRSNPYSGIASLFVGAASQNIGGAIDKSHENNQEIVTKGKGDINAEHSSPFGVADTMGSQMMPGAEKMLSANTKPLEVAPSSVVTPQTNVDSSQQAFSTKMQDYLNYMKYRS